MKKSHAIHMGKEEQHTGVFGAHRFSTQENKAVQRLP